MVGPMTGEKPWSAKVTKPIIYEECGNNQCMQLHFRTDFLSFPVHIESTSWEAEQEAAE